MIALIDGEESSDEADLDFINVVGGDNNVRDLRAVDEFFVFVEEGSFHGLNIVLLIFTDSEREHQVGVLVFEEVVAGDEGLVF